ncbi:MAG: hypothetical protein K9H06_17415 [Melioribacteraceae bacterium]|nr:hypothetical protein [Melioribacteraceae bacterium]
MSESKNKEKRCVAIHMPIELADKLDSFKAKTGKSQSGILLDFIERGLEVNKEESTQGKLLYFVKVRIDTGKMMEFGQKLKSGELDNSQTLFTFCLKDDPAVGLNIWQVDNKENFEKALSAHREFYKEVLEATPVVTASEAMKLLMQNMTE